MDNIYTMKNILLIAVALLTLASCKDSNKVEKDESITTDMDIAITEKASVKLYTLDGGTIQVNKLELFSQGEMYIGESKTLADPFYIIEHPKGKLVWDAGLAEGLVGQPPFTTPNGAFTVSRQDSVVSQLKKINLTPKDIDFIALSHTHFDHSGSAYVFNESTWLVQESEYDFITSEEQQLNNKDNYSAISTLNNVKKLNGDFDVFGDGTVVIKSMPGHTPGHQVLYLNLVETGPILLTGDLYHFQENRDNKGVPSFNYDVSETLKSMEAFEAFAKENNAKVYIQHELKDFNEMPKFPKTLQ